MCREADELDNCPYWSDNKVKSEQDRPCKRKTVINESKLCDSRGAASHQQDIREWKRMMKGSKGRGLHEVQAMAGRGRQEKPKEDWELTKIKKCGAGRSHRRPTVCCHRNMRSMAAPFPRPSDKANFGSYSGWFKVS